jgi:hypothetical protein
MKASPPTVFGSLQRYEKGGVSVIDANPRHYVFSNVFEVASRAKPWDKVVVAKNGSYVIEAIRAEGTSPWYTSGHDEAVLVMDGEVEIRLFKPNAPTPAEGREGTQPLSELPPAKKMGTIRARRGHLSLLPRGSAYQFHAARPSALIQQTLQGPLSQERWSDICQK